MSSKDLERHIDAKYKLHIIQIKITINSSVNKFISGLVVTNLSVVADHNMVAKIVIFRNFLTRKGWINLIGINVKTYKVIITIVFIQSLVPRI